MKVSGKVFSWEQIRFLDLVSSGGARIATKKETLFIENFFREKREQE
jgi:hypothetical protein